MYLLINSHYHHRRHAHRGYNPSHTSHYSDGVTSAPGTINHPCGGRQRSTVYDDMHQCSLPKPVSTQMSTSNNPPTPHPPSKFLYAMKRKGFIFHVFRVSGLPSFLIWELAPHRRSSHLDQDRHPEPQCDGNANTPSKQNKTKQNI